MILTTRRSCVAVTVLVTLLYVVGMAVFDTSVASHSSGGMGANGMGLNETEGQWTTRLLHAFTTAFLVGPVTLLATLMFRRAALLNIQLQHLVDRDRLTDASTRDFFFAQMEDKPSNYGVSLMVDIDNFKTVNDTYGHLAGDQVIRHVAQILRRNVRPQDIVARFGGEEFVVFLDEQDSKAGYEVAERMRQNIASELCDIDGVSLHVTVSIGGSMKEAVDNIEYSINKADEAMYRAKQTGRNRTVFRSVIAPALMGMAAD